MSKQTLIERYRFFRAHAGSWVGHSAEQALDLARAEETAERVGLMVVWEYETDFAWEACHEGETPPGEWLCGLVYKTEDVDQYQGTARRHAHSYACLGGVGVDSMRDPYLRVCSAELLSEALREIDKEWQADADVLAARATFAGVSP
jgi:hypothetical protein